MGVTVAGQAWSFAAALALGAAVGLLYDLFRVLRVRVRLPLLGGVLDFLFWALVTVSLFVLAVTAGNGEVRIYMVLAVFGGAAGYFLLLSRVFLKLGYALADLVGVLWHILVLPLVAIRLLFKKIVETAKKPSIIRRSGIK